MRNLRLTAEDMADLIAGDTINAMIEDGEEIALSAPDGVGTPEPGVCAYCHLPVHLGGEGLLVDERTGDWWCRANPSNGGDAAPHEVRS